MERSSESGPSRIGQGKEVALSSSRRRDRDPTTGEWGGGGDVLIPESTAKVAIRLGNGKRWRCSLVAVVKSKMACKSTDNAGAAKRVTGGYKRYAERLGLEKHPGDSRRLVALSKSLDKEMRQACDDPRKRPTAAANRNCNSLVLLDRPSLDFWLSCQTVIWLRGK